MSEFLSQKWGDLVALALLGTGIYLIAHFTDPTVRDLGKTLVGAGLLGLRMKNILFGAAAPLLSQLTAGPSPPPAPPAAAPGPAAPPPASS